MNNSSGKPERIGSMKRLIESVVPSLVLLIVMIGGLGLWSTSLPLIDPSNLGSLGLIGILPVNVFLAYAIIITGFCTSLISPSRTPLLPPLFLAALVLLLHATPAIGYETLRYSWAWKHIGVIDYIMRYGEVDPTARFLSAYHNWPGFFIFFAKLASTLNLQPVEIANFARFYPAALNLGFLAILPLVFRNFTTSRRIVWTAVAIFLVGNWVGQDYFSPQGTAFLLYLCLLALLTGPLSIAKNTVLQDDIWSVGQRVLQTFAAMLLILSIVAIHQITPIFLLSTLGLLAITRRISFGYLIFAIIAEVLWLLYFAHAFVAPELADVIASVGKLNSETVERLADTSVINDNQRLVVFVSRGLSAAVALFAFAGGLLRLKNGNFDFTAALLTLAPIPVLVATPYGGEIVFRLYLFAVPFLAFFAATLIVPGDRTPFGMLRLCNTAVVLFAMATAFVVANNGKDEQYYFSHAEIEAANWLYSNSQPGQLLIEGNRSYPSQFKNYENFVYVPLSEELPDIEDDLLNSPSELVVRWLRQSPNGGYVILTRSQKAAFENLGLLPAGEIANLEQKLTSSPHLKIAFSNSEAKIFTLSSTSLER